MQTFRGDPSIKQISSIGVMHGTCYIEPAPCTTGHGQCQTFLALNFWNGISCENCICLALLCNYVLIKNERLLGNCLDFAFSKANINVAKPQGNIKK